MDLENFDVETTDPVELAAMFNQMESGNSPNQPELDSAAEDNKVETVETKPVAADAPVEKEPDGVATKDGKHIIPYSVLQADRERARRAEEALAETTRQLAELQAKSSQGVKEGEIAAPAQTDDLSNEDLEALKEDFPTVYKGIMAMKKQAEMLEAQMKPVQATVQQQEQEAQRNQADMVQEAIDATPKLAHIKAQDPEAFALAAQFDSTLKASPQWAGRSLAERFAKVVEMVESANGEINVPGQQRSSQKTAGQLKADAQAAANAQARASKTAVPTSLSDFPAGQHAAATERDAIENMSTLQIAAKFAGMTADQQEAYLNNL